MYSTYEENHGINEEPEYSCPKIDKFIDEIYKIRKEIMHLSKIIDDDSKFQSELLQVSNKLKKLEDGFEYCRSQAESIRNWGDSWRDRSLDYFNSLSKTKQVMFIKKNKK